MKVLKRFKWIILSFFILFMIVFIWVGKDMFKAQYGALYGNRLDGIKEVPITDDDISEIKELLLNTEGIKKVSANVHGKIFSIVIFVDDKITVEKVKNTADDILEKCSDKQKEFYDISFLIGYIEETSKKDFPIIGYKNKNNDSIVW